MDAEKAQYILKGYKCFFCIEGPADRIGYYEKIYPNGKTTKENPTLFCKSCWEDPIKKEKINCARSGIDGVFCILFSSLGKMNHKAIGFLTGKRNHEMNDLSKPIWRKMIFNIHFLSLPPKGISQ